MFRMYKDKDRRMLDQAERLRREKAVADRNSMRRFSSKSTINISKKLRLEALSEVFGVLLLSAEFSRRKHSSQSVNQDSEQNFLGENEITTLSVPTESVPTDVLDSSLAMPSLLKPKLLADVIGNIINEVKPAMITRAQFISLVDKAMTLRKCPPLNILLSYPKKLENRAKSAARMFASKTTAEREGGETTCKPVLVARKVTEAYTKERTEIKRTMKKSHVDLLGACKTRPIHICSLLTNSN